MSNDITYREYRNEIESIAENVLDIEEQYPDDYSDISEIIWEEVDSHQWVIYNSYNLDVLKHADNEPEEWKHLVSDDDDWRKVLSVMAYKAMENDVWEEVNRQKDD